MKTIIASACLGGWCLFTQYVCAFVFTHCCTY